MNMIPPSEWDRYKDIIRDAHDTFNQQEVIWKRFIGGMNQFGEDDNQHESNFEDITLKTLVRYNVHRTWPITNTTETGKTDIQTALIIFNRKYLDELGYIDAEGRFVMDRGKDYFVLNGIRYDTRGDTDSSQAYDEPLDIRIIVQRVETATGEDHNVNLP